MSGSYSIKIRKRKKKKGKRKQNNPKPLIITFVLVSAVAGLTYWANYNSETVNGWLRIIQPQTVEHTSEPVYKTGIKIDGIDVSGLTYEQAEYIVKSKVNTVLDGNAITIKSSDGSKTYTYSYEDFGITFNLERALKSALEFGTVEEEYISDYKALANGTADFSIYSYSLPKIRSFVRAIVAENTVAVKNAVCVHTQNGFEIEPEEIGYSVNTDELMKNTISLIHSRNFNQELQFEIKTELPEITSEDFAYVENQLSSFSSQYTGGDENRIQNLKNGCEKLNGQIVYPDEIFSTNAAFNPCTEENGWRNAATIVGGKLEDSIGGGMCQVSSALYDAVLYAELEVVERHNHSMKVGYAQYAFDATLAGDYLDFKFRNNTGYPIYIESYLTSSNVVVKIYGYNRFSSSRTIKLENKFIEDIPHGDYKIIEDPELPEGTEKIEVSQLVGKKYELYKKVYENGELIETVKINTSTYKPRDGEKHIGTKKVESEINEPTTEATTQQQDVNVIKEPIIE